MKNASENGVYPAFTRIFLARRAFNRRNFRHNPQNQAKNKDIIVAVDNCYGEFIDYLEPTNVGADLIVGSLIKNAGGGIAPTGAYLAGKAEVIRQISYRFTSPSIGNEIGSYLGGYLPFYQGLFMAPITVKNAVKGSILFGQVYSDLGYETLPNPGVKCNDIIRSIKFDTEDELVEFIRGVQASAPIDSNVVPYPWDMPGYNDQVIMAAGAFVQGSSIELSADSPIRKPYVAYLQGSLTYEHAKIAVKQTIEYLIKNAKNDIRRPERHFIGLIVRKTRVLRIVLLYCTILKFALNHSNFCFFSPEKSFEKLSGLALIFCFTLFFKKRYDNQISNCFNKTKCALSALLFFQFFRFYLFFI